MTILPTSNQEAASVQPLLITPLLLTFPESSASFLEVLLYFLEQFASNREAQFWDLQALHSGYIIRRPADMANSSPLAGITFQWMVLF